ncbi:Hypothetical predicted protein [Cloeon dipterum]|uniref:Secreted protein n=1 Tax=Cloeon dipterum TaxID=197152 RepID=A0A8S1CVA3_9INSE|nr:Hypothetical predicted protein [Cloeon dipterum]
MRAIIFVALIPIAFSAVLPNLKPVLSDVIVTPKDLATDVAVAHLSVIDHMRDLIVRQTNQLQLHYLLIIDSYNKVFQITDLLQQLQVAPEVINGIGGTIYGRYLEYMYSFSSSTISMLSIKSELIGVNQKLNLLDPTLSSSHANLTSLTQTNANEFIAMQDSLKTMVTEAESAIVAAMDGLSGQQVIDVYLLIQDIKNSLQYKQEELQNADAVYEVVAAQCLFYIKAVADQLVP